MAKGGKRPKLKDIAREVGVSESAASLALAGKPGVSEATREKILAVAKEMRWEPNHAAKVLSGARTEAIGLVLARDMRDVGSEAFFLRFLTGIEEVLSSRGYGLLVQTVGTAEEEVEVYRRWNATRRVDGVIIVDLRVDDIRPRALKEMGMPAIITGAADPDALIPALELDDAVVMEQITDFLTGSGHRNIAYVCGDPNLRHVQDRLAKFEQDVRDAGGEPHWYPTDFSAASAVEATERALEKGPSAIIFENEFLAIAGVTTIRRHDLAIPGDVSVIMWEDSPVAEVVDPPMTAIHRDAFALGVEVTGQLLSILDGKEPTVTLDTRPGLVIRGSVTAFNDD